MKYIKYLIPGLLFVLGACRQQDKPADAYGNFEAIEVMVSAECSGRILNFHPLEGDLLPEGEVSLNIDTTQLYLKKLGLESGFASLNSRILTLDARLQASRVQMDNLLREKARVEKLLEGGAATSKQLDDIQGQVSLLQAQMAATASQKQAVFAERKTLQVQIRQGHHALDRTAAVNQHRPLRVDGRHAAGDRIQCPQ